MSTKFSFSLQPETKPRILATLRKAVKFRKLRFSRKYSTVKNTLCIPYLRVSSTVLAFKYRTRVRRIILQEEKK